MYRVVAHITWNVRVLVAVFNMQVKVDPQNFHQHIAAVFGAESSKLVASVVSGLVKGVLPSHAPPGNQQSQQVVSNLLTNLGKNAVSQLGQQLSAAPAALLSNADVGNKAASPSAEARAGGPIAGANTQATSTGDLGVLISGNTHPARQLAVIDSATSRP
jgi:hypothetical protein